MSQDRLKSDELISIIRLKGLSRKRKHRVAEIQADEAEEEIKEYANQQVQNTVRGDNL